MKMNINELDLSQFEYIGSEIEHNISNVGFKDYFIYDNLLVLVVPSVIIKFYDKKLSMTHSENLYMLNKILHLITKHINFTENYSNMMNNIKQTIGRNYITYDAIKLAYRISLRRRKIDELL